MAYTIPRKYFEKPAEPEGPKPPVDWEQVRRDMGLDKATPASTSGSSSSSSATSPLASNPILPGDSVDIVAVNGGPMAKGVLGPQRNADRDMVGVVNSLKGQAEKMAGRSFEKYELRFYQTMNVAGQVHFAKVHTGPEWTCVHLRIYSRPPRHLLTALLDNQQIDSVLEPFDAVSATAPPSYESTIMSNSTVHEVTSQDTIPSLSLRYGVPEDAIRTANNLHGANLQERRTVLIPSSSSSSPKPKPKDSPFSVFAKETGCNDQDEIRSYLARCEGDPVAAVKLWSEEVAGEREALASGARPPATAVQQKDKDKKKKKFLGIF